MAYRFTRDWFSHNIPGWQRWLADRAGQPGLRALEIGSFEGRATTWLLENILTDETSRIDCIDPFDKDYYRRFLANIKPWRHRVTVHRALSTAVLPTLGDAFDIIYIDGDHRPFAILSDAVLAWPRLKVGGTLIFDDYLFVPHEFDRQLDKEWTEAEALAQITEHPALCPKTAIDGFLAAMTDQYDLLGQGYQLALRKRGDPGDDVASLTFATTPGDHASRAAQPKRPRKPKPKAKAGRTRAK